MLNAALSNGHITEYEHTAMLPPEPKVSRFYGLAEDHKPYGRIPDFRPIASLCGSNIEKIGAFIEHHIHPLIQSIDTHLDDTPHFLREIENLKSEVGQFPEDVVPITVDVKALFPSIPIDDGMTAVKDALNKRQNKT